MVNEILLIAVLVLAAPALLYLVFGRGSKEDDAPTHTEAENGPQGEGKFVLDAKSPSGQYRASTTDSGRSVVLEHADQGVLWKKTLQRPNGLSVSDNGTVVVENWGSSHPDLTSELLAFDRQGETVLEEGYDALVRGSGIAADGKILWFLTASASATSESGDGDQLFVYDLEENRRLLKGDPPALDIDRVEKSGRAVEVITDGIHCRYEDGEMINADRVQWEKEERQLEEATTPNKVAGVARQRIERADQLSEDQIRSTIEAARNFDEGGSDRTWAKLWRRKGELHEHLGEMEQALTDYEKALSLNEDVGVDPRSRRLRDKLQED